jgi:hypothetical protein
MRRFRSRWIRGRRSRRSRVRSRSWSSRRISVRRSGRSRVWSRSWRSRRILLFKRSKSQNKQPLGILNNGILKVVQLFRA